MENSLINSNWRYAIIPLLLLVVAFQPNTVIAQKVSTERPKCTENVVGFVDGYVVFACVGGADGNRICSIKQEQCDCATNYFKNAIGCIDGSGIAYPKATDQSPDGRSMVSGSGREGADGTGTPVIHFLAGEKNCSIKSELNTYISSVISDSKSDVAVLPIGEGENLLWDFKAVESGNDLKGFYIVTHEASPRALIPDGTNITLQPFDQMDKSKRERAQWNFFINDRDADGTTNYLFRPQSNPDNLVLAANPDRNKLELVKNESGTSDTLVKKGADDGTEILPARKATDWNCHCTF